MFHCVGAEYSGPIRTGGHKTGTKLLRFFLLKYLTSFTGRFPWLWGGAGKGPGIDWSRVHLTPWIPGCNKISEVCIIKVRNNRCNIYWKANTLLSFYRLPLANLCCFSFFQISCRSRRTITLCKMGWLAYTTSTVRDIYANAVFYPVTRPFSASLVFMKATSCCVLGSNFK